MATTPAAPTGRNSSPSINGQGQIIDLGEMIVEGAIQKPAVFYVLSRDNPYARYKNLTLSRNLVNQIIRDAHRNPF